MRSVVIVVAVATICTGAHNPVADGKIRLARAVTTAPTVTPAPTPSTPVTSTVTNCMMSCNSQAANCYPGCFVPTLSVTAAHILRKAGNVARHDPQRDGEYGLLVRLRFNPACVSYDLRTVIPFAIRERHI